MYSSAVDHASAAFPVFPIVAIKLLSSHQQLRVDRCVQARGVLGEAEQRLKQLAAALQMARLGTRMPEVARQTE